MFRNESLYLQPIANSQWLAVEYKTMKTRCAHVSRILSTKQYISNVICMHIIGRANNSTSAQIIRHDKQCFKQTSILNDYGAIATASAHNKCKIVHTYNSNTECIHNIPRKQNSIYCHLWPIQILGITFCFGLCLASISINCIIYKSKINTKKIRGIINFRN